MKSIIIVGATSGIGFECAVQMARIAPNEQIIIACRNQGSGQQIVQKIKHKTGHKQIITMPLDLHSLQSVLAFKEQFAKQPNPRIIALLNNAGIQIITETEYTADGYEKTFGTNHLAPFYLTLLMLPFMDSNASITFTASGVHDPEQKTGVELPVFKNAREMAYPVETGETAKKIGMRRYSTSKLYNVLGTYALQRKLSNTNIRVNAFDPGLVPGTGLARTYSQVEQFAWKNIYPILRFFKHNVNTARDSGTRLANLAYADEYKDFKGKYFEGAKQIPSSADSYNQEYQDILWTSTLELLDRFLPDAYLPEKWSASFN